jgi:hypothetical protein
VSGKSLAIATPVGSFKGAFAHGVLTALEQCGIRADAYAAASSSVIPATWAALGQSADLGVDYWVAGWEALQLPNQNMSKVMQRGIRAFSRSLKSTLFDVATPTLYIATNAVVTTEAIELTQTDRAKDLGKQLMLASARQDRSWVDQHLQFALFSTRSDHPQRQITANNYPAVAYASSRIMHAWDLPASIEGLPFVDAAYTCLCPALAMAKQGYREVIAISNEPGTLYQDMFHLDAVPDSYAYSIGGSWQHTKIHVVRPALHLRKLGVDFTKASPGGLVDTYQYGQECGHNFVRTWN